MQKTRMMPGLLLACLFALASMASCSGSEPTAVPTPLPPTSETLLSEVASLCNLAFAQPPDTSAAPPAGIVTEASLLSLFSSAREDDAWQANIPMVPFIQALFAPDVRYVLCVQETRASMGQYDSGDFGYRLDWSARLIQWPDGQVLGATDLMGGEPPKTKREGSGPGYGTSPANELAQWVSGYFSANTLFPHPRGHVDGVAFSPDGRSLAVGGGCALGLWDTTTGRLLRTIPDHSGPVAYAPDGAVLAAAGGCDGRAVALLDPATGNQVRVLRGPRDLDELRAVAFSPDGATLASGESDGVIKIWDAATAKVIRTIDAHNEAVRSVVFSPDGTMLASAGLDNMAKLWDLATVTELGAHEHRGWVSSVAFAPDGTTLVSGGRDAVRLWDVATGKQRGSKVIYDHDRQHVNALAFSPDGTLLAVASSGGENAPATPWEWVMAHCITLLDAKTLRTTGTLCGHTNVVNSLAFSPDGSTLASGSADGFVKLWDMTTEQ